MTAFVLYDVAALAGLVLLVWLMVSYNRYDTRRWAWFMDGERAFDRGFRAVTDGTWNEWRAREAEHAQNLYFARYANETDADEPPVVLALVSDSMHSIRVADPSSSVHVVSARPITARAGVLSFTPEVQS